MDCTPHPSRSLASGFFVSKSLCLIYVKQDGYGTIRKKRYNPAIFFVAAPQRRKRMKIVEVKHPLVKHKLGLMREHDISTKRFRELASEVGSLLTWLC